MRYTNKPGPHRARFEELVNRTATCWLWTGYINSWGYGRLGIRPAHRAAYELFVGPIPEGMQIDHLCKVRNCVNPDHLEAVTPFENWRRSNNFMRLRADRTHCAKGHEFTPENTYINKTTRRGRVYTHRTCRTCRLARDAANRLQKKVAS